MKEGKETTERKPPANHILGAKLMTALRTSNNRKLESIWKETKKKQIESRQSR